MRKAVMLVWVLSGKMALTLSVSIVLHCIVAFRSAKAAFARSFAEPKATLIFLPMIRSLPRPIAVLDPMVSCLFALALCVTAVIVGQHSTFAFGEPLQIVSSEPAVTLQRSACQCRRCFVAESPNFRIHCCSSASRVRELAILCEREKSHCQSIWLGERSADWPTRCEVFVHLSLSAYSRALGPGSERTSGCSTIQLDQGRVVLRRIDLCGDAVDCLTDSLPHELTHVVLADQFTERRIPPWADEGIAMLAESPDKLQRRLNDLHALIGQKRTMELPELVNLTHPPTATLRDAFYGQSVTLAALLLERGTPEQLLQFIKAGQRDGYEQGLRDVYGIASWSALESEWSVYCGSQRMRLPANHLVPAPDSNENVSTAEQPLTADAR